MLDPIVAELEVGVSFKGCGVRRGDFVGSGAGVLPGEILEAVVEGAFESASVKGGSLLASGGMTGRTSLGFGVVPVGNKRSSSMIYGWRKMAMSTARRA